MLVHGREDGIVGSEAALSEEGLDHVDAAPRNSPCAARQVQPQILNFAEAVLDVFALELGHLGVVLALAHRQRPLVFLLLLHMEE